MVRRRPPEIVELYARVANFIALNYRQSWDTWARPDLDDFLPPLDDEEEGTADADADWSRVDSVGPEPPASSYHGSPLATPEPPPSQSSRGRKRAVQVRSPLPPDVVLQSPPRKRSRSQLSSTAPASSSVAPAPAPSPFVPTPFPASITEAHLRTIRDANQEVTWIAAAKAAGLMQSPVCFSSSCACTVILTFILSVRLV